MNKYTNKIDYIVHCYYCGKNIGYKHEIECPFCHRNLKLLYCKQLNNVSVKTNKKNICLDEYIELKNNKEIKKFIEDIKIKEKRAKKYVSLEPLEEKIITSPDYTKRSDLITKKLLNTENEIKYLNAIIKEYELFFYLKDRIIDLKFLKETTNKLYEYDKIQFCKKLNIFYAKQDKKFLKDFFKKLNKKKKQCIYDTNRDINKVKKEASVKKIELIKTIREAKVIIDLKEDIASVKEKIKLDKEQFIQNNISVISEYPSFKINKILEEEIEETKKLIDKTINKINELYKYAVLYPKYKNYRSIYMLYKYLNTKKARYLEEAYNIYEKDYTVYSLQKEFKTHNNVYMLEELIKQNNENITKYLEIKKGKIITTKKFKFNLNNYYTQKNTEYKKLENESLKARGFLKAIEKRIK